VTHTFDMDLLALLPGILVSMERDNRGTFYCAAYASDDERLVQGTGRTPMAAFLSAWDAYTKRVQWRIDQANEVHD